MRAARYGPDYKGYLLVSSNWINVMKVVQKLKALRILTPRNKWIIALEQRVNQSLVKTAMAEGYEVVLLSLAPSDKSLSLVEDSHCLQQHPTAELGQSTKVSTDEEAYHVWSLFSNGDGTVVFCHKGSCSVSGGLQLDSETQGQTIYFLPFEDFKNRTLRISTYGSYPIRQPPSKDETRWSGYMFEIINFLADLLNFTYTVHEPADRMYGIRLDNGNWTGMIGELIAGTVDIAAGDLSWSPDRSKAVDFTVPVFSETVTFLSRSPKFYSRAWILFQPFPQELWISLVCTSTILAVLFLLLHVVRERFVMRHQLDIIGAIKNSLSYSYRVLVTQGIPIPPSCPTARVLCSMWMLVMVVFNAIYSGNLTSTLGFHRTERPPDTLEDLIRRRPNIKLAVREGSIVQSYFEHVEKYRELWIKNIRPNLVPGTSSMDDIMTIVRDKGYVWISERAMMEKRMRDLSVKKGVCDFYLAKERILRSDWALALRPDSPFLEQFNTRIRNLCGYGMLLLWRNKYWDASNGTCRETDGYNQIGLTPITIADSQAVFFLHAVGLILGWIILAVELLCTKIFPKRRVPPIQRVTSVIVPCRDESGFRRKPKTN